MLQAVRARTCALVALVGLFGMNHAMADDVGCQAAPAMLASLEGLGAAPDVVERLVPDARSAAASFAEHGEARVIDTRAVPGGPWLLIRDRWLPNPVRRATFSWWLAAVVCEPGARRGAQLRSLHRHGENSVTNDPAPPSTDTLRALDPAGARVHDAERHVRNGQLDKAHFALVQATHLEPELVYAHWLMAQTSAELRDARGVRQALSAAAEGLVDWLGPSFDPEAVRPLLLEALKASPWPSARSVADTPDLREWAGTSP